MCLGDRVSLKVCVNVCMNECLCLCVLTELNYCVYISATVCLALYLDIYFESNGIAKVLKFLIV